MGVYEMIHEKHDFICILPSPVEVELPLSKLGIPAILLVVVDDSQLPLAPGIFTPKLH